VPAEISSYDKSIDCDTIWTVLPQPTQLILVLTAKLT